MELSGRPAGIDDAGLETSVWPEDRATIAKMSRAKLGGPGDHTWGRRAAHPSSWMEAVAATWIGEPPGAGRQVGPYRLVEPLGSGGQAVVWRALKDGPPPREVALKMLVKSPTCHRRRIEMLHGEARHGARLNHPSILAVTDIGIADGVAYLAMPLVEGGSLADALAQRRRRTLRPSTSPAPAPADDLWLATLAAPEYSRAVARIVARIARALDSAHQANVIHCDVKPSNILLDRHRPEQVYLADFGLGLDLDAATPEQLLALKGTPMYMAPEKLRGRPGDGKLCDVYALGVTLFEAATEVMPFRLREGTYPPVVQMAQVLAQEPPRPRTVAPRLSRQLEAIILTAMAPDPSRRYPRATAMAEDLEHFLAGRQVGALARRAG